MQVVGMVRQGLDLLDLLDDVPRSLGALYALPNAVLFMQVVDVLCMHLDCGWIYFASGVRCCSMHAYTHKHFACSSKRNHQLSNNFYAGGWCGAAGPGPVGPAG
jgi:hypothetical protein